MVGVNNYPDLNGKPMEAAPAAETRHAPFPQFRLAEPFEKIRRTHRAPCARDRPRPKSPAAEARRCQDAHRPRQLRAELLRLRRLRNRRIRRLCRDTDADLIVLCSSDPEYLPFAQEVCAAVKVPVIVAGNPKDQIDALKAAGVQGFIHIASDAVETLTDWQNRLGVRN